VAAANAAVAAGGGVWLWRTRSGAKRLLNRRALPPSPVVVALFAASTASTSAWSAKDASCSKDSASSSVSVNRLVLFVVVSALVEVEEEVRAGLAAEVVCGAVAHGATGADDDRGKRVVEVALVTAATSACAAAGTGGGMPVMAVTSFTATSTQRRGPDTNTLHMWICCCCCCCRCRCCLLPPPPPAAAAASSDAKVLTPSAVAAANDAVGCAMVWST